MNLKDRFKTTPVWLVLPTLMVAGAVGAVASGYEPLVFDPSLYETNTADAAELTKVDAESIEKANKKEAKVEKTVKTAATGTLADGTWTGYSACGESNTDGWKPYYVAVTVEVVGGKVKRITNIEGSSTGGAGDSALSWDASENQSYLDWAIDGRNSDEGVKPQINSRLASGSSISDVDTVSGATYSSIAIYNAYVDAVNQAAKAAGSATTTPAKKAANEGASKPSSKKKKTKADTNVGKLADGTWTAYAPCGKGNEDDWQPYYVGVTLTVSNGKVVSIDKVFGSSTGNKGDADLSYDETENGSYLNWAIDGRTRGDVTYKGVLAQLKSFVAKGKNASSIDVVSGATYSSDAIFEAYYAALKMSAAAAGSTVEEPDTPSSDDSEKADDSGNTNDSDKTDESGKTDEPGKANDQELPEGVPSIYGDFADGAYSGYALCGYGNMDGWSPYYLIVEVQASNGRITTISDVYGDVEGIIDPAYIYNGAENSVYLNKALTRVTLRGKGVQLQVQDKLDAGEQAISVDTVSGATYSCDAFFKAYYNAVQSAQDSVSGTDGSSESDVNDIEAADGEADGE